MKDFNAAIREIEEALGDGGSRKLAETIYARLMADGMVTYTRDGVEIHWGRFDLFEVAEAVAKSV